MSECAVRAVATLVESDREKVTSRAFGAAPEWRHRRVDAEATRLA
jgi:hypothetical protein